MQKHLKKMAIIGFWLLVWQIAAVIVDNPLVFVGPIETSFALAQQLFEVTFWQTLLASAGRIASGFVIAFVVGCIMGGLATRFSLLQEGLEPMVLLMRTVPVASLVILVLIVMGVEGLTGTISFLVVFPLIYQATLTGLAAAPKSMLEMAKVFRLSWWKRALYLYRPALWPSLVGASKTALGMSWKSGVAAEVIGVPDLSIGAELYLSKIYFDTASLFAWTLVIILLSVCFERLFLRILQMFGRPWGEWLSETQSVKMEPAGIQLQNVTKSYREKTVLKQLSFEVEPGKIIGLMAPSGGGKTTLFRILMGLETADEGAVCGLERAQIGVAFQEDRLCEVLTAEENAKIAGGRPDLARILPGESLEKTPNELSGGMKRRVAVARAMAAPSHLILLDEPFAGLDEETKALVMAYILEKRQGRTLLFTTHDEDDIKKMQAVRYELPTQIL